jgi:uncharacterized protein (TIGR00255 family)
MYTVSSVFLRTFNLLPFSHKQDNMVKSMTGFGRAEETVGDKTFLVDVKSLNGKQFELQLKLPGFLKPYEFDIRKILSEKLGRGSRIVPSV